ncbi:MAG TPA: biotin carboxylase N-terminal domain-containing protein [Thermoplasmata archaeon]|nr:biotin carboxylase N-terminal domain-containing protein [Thermoplasmata archaeon]
MFRRLLIANRGEIAIRVSRTARAMGIVCIGVYSHADRSALHRKAMDESVEIGGPLPVESYLNIEAVLRAAKETGADAIHPGYGFLSENAEFAERCEEAGIVFVGPPAAAMAVTGDKVAARKAMERAGVPVTLGVDRVLRSIDEARSVASALGYPVLFKATAGGGGIGMARVDKPSELAAAFDSARSVARTNFGNPDLFLEKYLLRARHVEVQVLLADNGVGVGFVERECSVQRRHQKLVEETPSPAVGPKLRSRLLEVAVRGLRALGYKNAGTVEFLLHQGEFTFNEVNARLQVEHPITEMVTGVDLVRQQLSIAADDGLEFAASEITRRGHAIECRVNAEDPVRNFLPSPGRIHRYREPSGQGVRVDSGVAEGSIVPPFYDSLIAKLIVHGRNRATAVARMEQAVDAFDVRGVHTNLPFHHELLRATQFRQATIWTTMVADLRIAERIRGRGPWEESFAAVAAALVHSNRLAAGVSHTFERARPSPWTATGRRMQVAGGDHAIPARRRW